MGYCDMHDDDLELLRSDAQNEVLAYLKSKNYVSSWEDITPFIERKSGYEKTVDKCINDVILNLDCYEFTSFDDFWNALFNTFKKVLNRTLLKEHIICALFNFFDDKATYWDVPNVKLQVSKSYISKSMSVMIKIPW